jgi:hypothetical protein
VASGRLRGVFNVANVRKPQTTVALRDGRRLSRRAEGTEKNAAPGRNVKTTKLAFLECTNLIYICLEFLPTLTRRPSASVVLLVDFEDFDESTAERDSTRVPPRIVF